MSTTRCAPASLNSDTVRSGPSGTIAAFAAVWPGPVRLSVDVFGSAPPPGYAVTKPAPPASVPVTLSTTALAVGSRPSNPNLQHDRPLVARRRVRLIDRRAQARR